MARRKFFIGTTLKALRGIQRIYGPRGYEVYAQFRYDGKVNVAVIPSDVVIVVVGGW